jgi:hypothetical protein
MEIAAEIVSGDVSAPDAKRDQAGRVDRSGAM